MGWSDSEDGDHDFWDFSRSNFVEFSDSATECLRLSLTNGGGGEGDKDELRLLKFGFLKGLGDLYLDPPGLLWIFRATGSIDLQSPLSTFESS